MLKGVGGRDGSPCMMYMCQQHRGPGAETEDGNQRMRVDDECMGIEKAGKDYTATQEDGRMAGLKTQGGDG